MTHSHVALFLWVVCLFITPQGTVFAFTEDFSKFLSVHYPKQDFEGKKEGVNSSYGGKTIPDESIEKRPVILVHGSTDQAVGGHSGSWQKTIEALRSEGYNESEIYALTWGNGQKNSGSSNNHREAYIQLVRSFIEAVLAYTKTDQVDLIAHSMGVTLSRGAIKGITKVGGVAKPPLGHRINTFVAIAGGNRGVGACLNPYANVLPTCSKQIGFHPESAFLAALNNSPTREASRIFTFWSAQDDVIGQQVFGTTNPVPPAITSRISNENQSFSFDNYSHIALRDSTVAVQLNLLSGNAFLP